ncbi:uncharacterized protein [Ambystoma mexicanum]|uniref:uncharacterized protein n=1 Tax=Ambystoma mexicanum TaxID=8296 RepID=UPI0037E86377
MQIYLKKSSIKDIHRLYACLIFIQSWMSSAYLKLHPSKTELLLLTKNTEYPDIQTWLSAINLKGFTPQLATCAKSLGFNIDRPPHLQTTHSKEDINGLTEALHLLGPQQLAEFTVTTALNNLTEALEILTVLELLDYAAIRQYMISFNFYAQQANLTTLPNAAVRDAVLRTVWKKLALYFYYFSSDMWGEWLQALLPLVIQDINEAQIAELRTDATCGAYQAIVKGFNMVHNRLTSTTFAQIYETYIKNYLEQNAAATGVACDVTDPLDWIELNLGDFKQLITFQELLSFNQHFNEVEADRTPTQLADLTFIADHFCNKTLSIAVLAQVKNFATYGDLHEYLARLQGIQGTSTDYSDFAPCDSPSAGNHLTNGTQRDLLSSLLFVLSKEWSLLDASRWLQVFHTIILEFQGAVNGSHFSQLPLNLSCETYQAIMKDLNEIYPTLTETGAIHDYSYSSKYLFMQQRLKGSACTQDTNGTEAWLEKNFGRFYSTATITELLSLYPELSLAVILTISTTDDVAKLVADSAITQNISLLETMLSTVKPQDVPQFVHTFTSEAAKANLSVSQITTLEETLLTVVFTEISPNFSSYNTEDWAALFQVDIQLLLSHIKESQLQLLPTNIICSAYQAILKGLNMAYLSVPNITRMAIYQRYIRQYLIDTALSAVTGVACDANNLTVWIAVNLGQFIQQSSLDDLVLFNKNVSKVFDLSLLTTKELAEITTFVDSFKNSTLTQTILGKIKYFGSNAIFLDYLLPMESIICPRSEPSTNPNVCNTSNFFQLLTQEELLNNIFDALNMDWSLKDMDQWIKIFQIVIELFGKAINESQIYRLPLNLTCEAYQAIIKILSDISMELGENDRYAVYVFCKRYLSQEVNKTGSACASNTNGTINWKQKNLGNFSSFTSISDFKSFYPNLNIVELLDTMSAEDVVGLATKPDAINDPSLLKQIFSLVTTNEVPQYTQLILLASTKANLSVTQTNAMKETLLSAVWETISSDFYSFTADDWKTLIQQDLIALLDSFTETQLQQLPTNISCSSYQQIVTGFDMQYNSLSLEEKLAIYNIYIRKFLIDVSFGTGTRCNATNIVTWVDMYLQQFIQQSNIQDLAKFNKQFAKVFDLSLLTTKELAEITTFVDSFKNSTLTQTILGKIKYFGSNAIFLDYLLPMESIICPRSEPSTNPNVCNTSHFFQLLTQEELLNNIFDALNMDWSLKDMDQWIEIFQIIIELFRKAINESQIYRLPLNLTCEAYQAIIKNLSDISMELGENDRYAVYVFCKRYLSQEVNKTGSACASNTNGTMNWKEKNLGNFSSFISISEFKSFYPNLNIVELLDTMSAEDVVGLATKPDAINDPSLLKQIFSLVTTNEVPQYTQLILLASTKANLSVSQTNAMKETLLSAVLETIRSDFYSFTPDDWKTLIQEDLIALLGSFTETQLQQLPTNISCSSYQQIVTGFDMQYNYLSLEEKLAIYNTYIRKFLIDVSFGTGTRCNATNIVTWVDMYLQQFIQQSNIQDLAKFNKQFAKVFDLSLLTTKELAEITTFVDSFKNSTLTQTILGKIKYFGSNAIFLEYLLPMESIICPRSEPSTNPNVCNTSNFFQLLTQEELLNNIFDALNMDWSLKDMDQWIKIFQIIIELFGKAINESQIYRLPLNLTCEAYQAIIKNLSDISMELGEKDRYAVYVFCKRYLSQEVNKTGSACASNTNGTMNWKEKNLGNFSSFISISEFKSFYPNLNIVELLDTMSAEDVVGLATKPDAINDPSLLKQIFSLVTTSEVPQYTQLILLASTKANLSVSQTNAMKETLLSAVWETIRSDFYSFTPDDWKTLIQEDLIALLDSFTETQLQQLPTNISCSSYQQIVTGFDMQYNYLLLEEKLAIYNTYIRKFLIDVSFGTGTRCNATNIVTWVDMYLQQFIQQSNIQDLAKFNKQFAKVFDLSLLTTKELAEITTFVDSFKNSTLTQTILGKIKYFESNAIFLDYLLPMESIICPRLEPSTNPNVCNTSHFFQLLTQEELLNNIFDALNMDWSLKDMDQWIKIFQIIIELFGKAINESQIYRLPLNLTCEAYQAIIKNLSDISMELGENDRYAVYVFCKRYLSQEVNKTGSACASNTNGTMNWKEKNLGNFSSFISISEFKSFYPNLNIVELLDTMSAEDVVGLATKPDAINDPSLLKQIFSLVTTNEVSQYTQLILLASTKANLSVSQTNAMKETLLSAVWETISSDFYSFTADDWKTLIQQDLIALLGSFTETQLQQLPTNISCSSYQQIVTGFDMQYNSLSLEEKLAIYNLYIRKFLIDVSFGTGTRCNATNIVTWVDMYLQQFIQQSNIQDLAKFNKQFAKVFDLSLLTTKELAEITTFVDSFKNSTLTQTILGKIKYFGSNAIFLDYLLPMESIICSRSEPSTNPNVCNTSNFFQLLTQEELLNNIFDALNMDWSLKDMDQWIKIFQIIIELFGKAINESQIYRLPMNLTCEAYQAIIKNLSDISMELGEKDRYAVYVFCKRYLSQEVNKTGSACASNTNGTMNWKEKNLGNFSSFISISDFKSFYPNLNIVELLDTMKAEDVVGLATKPDAINDPSLLKQIFSLVTTNEVPQYTQLILLASTKANLSVSQTNAMKETLLSAVLETIHSDFYSFTADDWKTLIQQDLIALLGSFTETQLQQLPTNISCSSYQQIVMGFDMQYNSLSLDEKLAIYNIYIRKFLTGTLCYASNPLAWVDMYLKQFIQLSNIQDLVKFNQVFEKMENPDHLSTMELANFTFIVNALNETNSTSIVLGQIQDLSSYESLIDYLGIVTSNWCQNVVSSTSTTSCNETSTLNQLSLQTQQELISNTFIVLNMEWMLLNMDQWLQAFKMIFFNFIQAMNESHIAKLPFNISCDGQREMARVINDKYNQLAVTLQSSIFQHLLKFHTDSRLACDNETSFQAFLNDHFFIFAKQMTAEDLVALIPVEQLSQKINSLQPTELTAILLRPGSNVNITAWKIVLSHTDINNLGTVMEHLAGSQINVTMENRIDILSTVWSKVVMDVKNVSSTDLDTWLNLSLAAFLSFLAPNQFNVSVVTTVNCPALKNLAIVLNYTKNDFNLVYQKNIFQHLLTLHKGSGLTCDNETNFHAFLEEYFQIFLNQMTAEDLVALIPGEQLSQKLNTLQPTELAAYLLRSGYINVTAWTILLSHYTDVSNTGTVLDILNNTLVNLTMENRIDIFAAVWPIFVKAMRNLSSVDLKLWLEQRLPTYLTFLTPNQLNVSAIIIADCPALRNLAQVMNYTYSQLNLFDPKSMFQYLLAFHRDSNLKCDNETYFQDFLEKYFLNFLSQMSAEDLLELIPWDQLSQKLNRLQPTELAAILTRPGSSINSTAWGMIFRHYTDMTSLMEVLDIVRKQYMGSLTSENGTDILAAVWPVFVDSLPSLNSTFLDTWLSILLHPYLPFLTTQQLQVPGMRNTSCQVPAKLARVMNGTYDQLTVTLRSSFFQYLLTFHTDSRLACDNETSFQVFLNENFFIFAKQMTAEDLVALIPVEQLSQRIGDLRPDDLAAILTRPGSSINSTAWGIIFRHYTVMGSLVDVLDIVRKQYVVSLTSEYGTAILTALWPIFVDALPSLNSTFLDTWLDILLQPFLPFFTAQQLQVPGILNTSCQVLAKLVKILTDHYDNYTESIQRDIYSVFKANLLQPGTKPRCYNATDTAWFQNYLGKYMIYTSVDDLQSFADNKTLQRFSINTDNLKLVNELNITEDVKIFYAALILMENPSINLESIPPNLKCYVVSQLSIGLKNNTQSSQILQSLQTLTACGIHLTVLHSEVLINLIDSVDSVSDQILNMIGSLVVTISPSNILQKLNGTVLLAHLSDLGSYTGWSTTQASAIVSNLGLQINESTIMLLGTLVTGIPAASFDKLTDNEIQRLSLVVKFIRYMEMAPTALQQRFVQRLLNSMNGDIFQLVPDNMSDFIPPSRLVLSKLNLNEINTKKWTSYQASVFFQIVLKSITIKQFSEMSASVLQGFTCGASQILDINTFASLIQAMRTKDVTLSSSQLSCITKILPVKGTAADIENYPKNVLLYIGPEKYSNTTTCRAYFTLIGQANINLLTPGSSKRQSLLTRALSCLNISSSYISKENLMILGNLACELNGTYIEQSDTYILTVLEVCASFTVGQMTGIEQNLKVKYRDPSTWTNSTLSEMGSIAWALKSSTLQTIPEGVKTTFFPNFLRLLKKRNKQQFQYCLSQLKKSNTRAKIDKGVCSSAVLTTNMVLQQQDLIVANYGTSSDLDACLPNDVLEKNLELFGQMDFSDDIMKMLKANLYTIFQGAPPEAYFPQLGNLARAYTADEIGGWNITKVDTLGALLEKTLWENDLEKVQALVKRYQNETHTQLDGTVLTILAPYICALQYEDINAISNADFLASTTQVDVTSCSQNKRNLLFSKLKSAYAASRSSTTAFYELMKAAIGGAQAEDLISFSKASPVMDIDTFAGLNPKEVMKLNAQTLRDLLSVNLGDLNLISNSAVVREWVSVHTQSEVNSIGLSLLAGIKDPVPDGFMMISPGLPASGALACTKIPIAHYVYQTLISCLMTTFVTTFTHF